MLPSKLDSVHLLPGATLPHRNGQHQISWSEH